MFWLIVNSLGFVGTPVGLVWAWVAWSKRSQGQARGARETVSLIAVSAATLGPVILFVARFFHPPASRSLDWVGLLLAGSSILVCLFGRLRFAIPVCLASIGSIMLWYGMTLR